MRVRAASPHLTADDRHAFFLIGSPPGISNALSADFDLWLYNFYTAWSAKGFLLAISYTLWCLGPWITDPTNPTMTTGDFLVMLDVITLLSGSVLGLQASIVSVYTSGASDETRASRCTCLIAGEAASAVCTCRTQGSMVRRD